LTTCGRARLYLAGLKGKLADSGRWVVFKAVFEDLSLPSRN
jgi:hypothetical protein